MSVFFNLIVLYFMYLFIHIHRNMFSRVFFMFALSGWSILMRRISRGKRCTGTICNLVWDISSWLMIRNGTNYLQDGAPQL